MGADIVNLANVLSTQTAAIAPDAQAKQVLKEAVDAVVNSFAKHTQGYGRGKFDSSLSILFSVLLKMFFVVLDCVCARFFFLAHLRSSLCLFLFCYSFDVLP